MLILKSIEFNVVGIISLWVKKLLFVMCLIIGGVSIAHAVPLTPSGFDPDAGATYFIPDTAGSVIMGFELVDPLEPATTFGFYFRSDFSTLIPMFDGTDSESNEVAAADFINGVVIDVDKNLMEMAFVTSAGSIGFYINVAGTTFFSDPLLNPGGRDLFTAFKNIATPTTWEFVFEGVDQNGLQAPINLNLIAGITAVPEPSTIALFAVVILIMLLSATRRRRSWLASQKPMLHS